MLFRSAAALIALALAAFMLVPSLPASAGVHALLNELGLPTLLDTGASIR
ncbi:MAG: hypothetical protein ABIO40_02740 [Devosia sp.]